jgi:hypothetical protein
MGTLFTDQGDVAGNTSPPADDGSQVEANKIKWSTVTGKVYTPTKNYVEALNDAVLAALDTGTNTQGTNYQILAADHDKVVQLTASATATLPAASTSSKFRVAVYNGHSAANTVARSGSDTINGASKNLSLAPGQLVWFQVNAAANGWLTEISPLIADQTDPSKQARFDASGITTGTVRVITLPDANITLGLGVATGVGTTFLGADVNLNNTANFFSGPNTGSIGASGQVWLIIGTATFTDTAGGATCEAAIFDGTNYIANSATRLPSANVNGTVTVQKVVTLTGATTFTLRGKDVTSTSGVLVTTGLTTGVANAATSITAIRLH